MKQLFKGKKVTIMGLGLHGGGVGIAKFFCLQGADVLVTDLKTKEQLSVSIEKLKKFKIRYTLAKHEAEDFITADLIIKNPDVSNSSPYLEIARKNNVEIETDVNLFFKLSKAFIIGVTGTKGKSTVSSLIYRILKAKYGRVFLAGNIGVSPLELLFKIKKNDKVVLELSSFELEDLKQSPNIALIINIMEDHLNRYATMSDYIEAKKIIFKYQKKNDVLVLNNDDPLSKIFAKEAKSKVYFFSEKEREPEVKIDNLKLFGRHNLSNILAAVAVAKIFKIPSKTIEKIVKNFKGVPNRQEFIKEINGVKYFNDTTATIPEATIAAIYSFSENFPNSRLILICGGQNKGLKYGELSKVIKEKIEELVMLPGNASDKIKEDLSEYAKINEVSSMQDAVKKAKELAKKGDIVLLSPASASFNIFQNEFDRGEQFNKFVRDLK